MGSRGVEQRQLVGLITRRSAVRIRPPQPRPSSRNPPCGRVSWFLGLGVAESSPGPPVIKSRLNRTLTERPRGPASRGRFLCLRARSGRLRPRAADVCQVTLPNRNQATRRHCGSVSNSPVLTVVAIWPGRSTIARSRWDRRRVRSRRTVMCQQSGQITTRLGLGRRSAAGARRYSAGLDPCGAGVSPPTPPAGGGPPPGCGAPVSGRD